MRRSARELIAFVTTLLLTVPVAVAAGTAKSDALRGLDSTAGTQGAGLVKTEIPVLVGRIIFAVLSLVGIIMVVLFIYGGFLWMTAQGNEEQITKAKGIIKNCIIGIVICMSAYVVTNFVIDAVIASTSGE